MGSVAAVPPSDSAPAWWQRGAIYQIYPRSFADADGDGVGDLRGVIEHLDHLNDGTERSLGVEAIWLSPFYVSPMADYGYDVADYTDVDPLFGTLEDFDELVEQAHARGMRVVIDFVPNHSSDRHPWFVEARASRDSPRRDWYVWRDGDERGGAGEPPNDWVSNFGAVGRAWTWDEATEQWYLHSFLPEQPDLNWDEPAVEAALHDAMRFWLDRGVDGFRLDVIHAIAKDPELRSNAGSDRPHHEDWQPTIHERLQRLRAMVDERGGHGARGRGLPPGPRARRRVRQQRATSCTSRTTSRSYASRGTPRPSARTSTAGRRPPATWRGRPGSSRTTTTPASPRASTTRAWGRRGRGPCCSCSTRCAGRRSSSRARSSGCPTRRSRRSGSSTSTAATPSARRSRGSARRSPARAPASATGDPWLPLATRTPSATRSPRRRDDPASTLSLARRLAWLRRGDPVLQAGDQRTLDAGDDLLAWVREGDGGRWLAAVSFATAPRRLALADAGLPPRGALVVSTVHGRPEEGAEVDLDGLELAAGEAVLLRLA